MPNAYLLLPGNKAGLIASGVSATMFGMNISANMEQGGGTEEVVKVYAAPGDAEVKTRAIYIRKQDFVTTETVAIPANFAGLESQTVPTRVEDQLFRVYEVEENEDYVTIRARHVWYDNYNNYTLWKPNKNTRYSGAAACRNILTNAASPVNSNVASDCTSTKKLDETAFERKNIVECFLDPENGICAKYGLSLIRDNWDFYCLKNVGYNRGLVIQNGKNLLGVERKESIDNLVTRVLPFGKNRKGKIVWLNNNNKKYVDSSHIDDYSHPYVEIYDTGIQVGKDGVTDQNINDKLLTAGQKRFTDDKADIPEVEMTIEFLSLGDTEEYVQYRNLDKVYLYDILTIKDTVRGYNYSAQVIGVEHDILTGMLNSITIGSFTNASAKRKIATWQVPEVDGTNIRLQTIMEGSFADGAIFGEDIADNVISYAHFAEATVDQLNADAIEAVTADIEEIIAGKVTADSIDTSAIDAINATLGIAQIADAEIATANISYAQIKDADVQSLIARDAVTDRYYIDKLAVNNVQAVYSQVGELVVKASDDHYYRLDINANGELSATDVTSSLTPEEIAAGETADGRSSIIETDLTTEDLSASSLKAINGLISKLTASRIDVAELFARQATISQLNTVNISNNQSISIAVRSQLGQGKQFMQATEPTDPVTGDIWFKLVSISGSKTWEQLEEKTWEDLEAEQWGELSADFYETYRYNGDEWVMTDSYTNERIGSLVDDGDGIITGITISQNGILMEGEKFIRMETGQTKMDLTPDGIKMKTGNQTNMELSSDGIDMQTAGTAMIHAKDATGSAIIFGSDVNNANFAVDITGDMLSKSLTTNSITLGGYELPIIMVGANQPDGHNILWVKPSSSTGKQWAVYPENKKINTSGGTLTYYRDYTITYSASDYLAGALYYGVKVRLYVYELDTMITPNVTLKARLKNGSSWIDLGDVTKRFYSTGYLELDNDLSSTNTNVMNVSGGTFTIRIETNYDYNKCRLPSENIILRARTTGSSGVASCEMFYIN